MQHRPIKTSPAPCLRRTGPELRADLPISQPGIDRRNLLLISIRFALISLHRHCGQAESTSLVLRVIGSVRSLVLPPPLPFLQHLNTCAWRRHSLGEFRRMSGARGSIRRSRPKLPTDGNPHRAGHLCILTEFTEAPAGSFDSLPGTDREAGMPISYVRT